jgi:hypothetical protein
VRRSRRVLTIATTQGRDLLRRHLALIMLASLPALFYLSVAGQHIRKGQDPWTLDIAVIGVAWAVAGGAFFLACPPDGWISACFWPATVRPSWSWAGWCSSRPSRS